MASELSSFLVCFTKNNHFGVQAPWPNYALISSKSHAVCLGAKFFLVSDSALDADILSV